MSVAGVRPRPLPAFPGSTGARFLGRLLQCSQFVASAWRVPRASVRQYSWKVRTGFRELGGEVGRSRLKRRAGIGHESPQGGNGMVPRDQGRCPFIRTRVLLPRGVGLLPTAGPTAFVGPIRMFCCDKMEPKFFVFSSRHFAAVVHRANG